MISSLNKVMLRHISSSSLMELVKLRSWITGSKKLRLKRNFREAITLEKSGSSTIVIEQPHSEVQITAPLQKLKNRFSLHHAQSSSTTFVNYLSSTRTSCSNSRSVFFNRFSISSLKKIHKAKIKTNSSSMIYNAI